MQPGTLRRWSPSDGAPLRGGTRGTKACKDWGACMLRLREGAKWGALRLQVVLPASRARARLPRASRGSLHQPAHAGRQPACLPACQPACSPRRPHSLVVLLCHRAARCSLPRRRTGLSGWDSQYTRSGGEETAAAAAGPEQRPRRVRFAFLALMRLGAGGQRALRRLTGLGRSLAGGSPARGVASPEALSDW